MNCPNCFASTSCHFLLLFPLRYFKVCKAFLQSQHRGKQAVLSIYESFTSHFATIISTQMNISGNKYPYEQTQSSKCSNACKNHSIHLKSYSLMIFNSLGISLKSFQECLGILAARCASCNCMTYFYCAHRAFLPVLYIRHTLLYGDAQIKMAHLYFQKAAIILAITVFPKRLGRVMPKKALFLLECRD